MRWPRRPFHKSSCRRGESRCCHLACSHTSLCSLRTQDMRCCQAPDRWLSPTATPVRAAAAASGQQVQGRRDHQLVLGEVVGRPREIDRDVPVMERVVEEHQVLPLLEQAGRRLGQLERPFVGVTEQDRHLGPDLGALEHRGQQAEFLAHLADLPIHPVVASPVVGENTAVELLRSDPRLPPEEV